MINSIYKCRLTEFMNIGTLSMTILLETLTYKIIMQWSFNLHRAA